MSLRYKYSKSEKNNNQNQWNKKLKNFPFRLAEKFKSMFPLIDLKH